MNGRIYRIIIAIESLLLIAILMICGRALACEGMHDTGIANTSVYVRTTGGEIAGSLRTGDAVTVTGRTGSWYRVDIGGTEYRVFRDYIDLTDVDTKSISKPRKSKSASDPVKNKSKHKISGSAFDGLRLW